MKTRPMRRVVIEIESETDTSIAELRAATVVAFRQGWDGRTIAEMRLTEQPRVNVIRSAPKAKKRGKR